MFHRILLAWDGSKPAKHALDTAVDIARRYDADIVAVSVAYSPSHAETTEDALESVEAAKEHLQGTLESVRDRADRVGVDLEHVIIEGDHPAERIVEYAHAHGFDLVVTGRHRTGRAGRLLLHGLAERFAETSDIAVLIVGEANGG
jgi:nucleotide-binding universal stress UspA family protein